MGTLLGCGCVAVILSAVVVFAFAKGTTALVKGNRANRRAISNDSEIIASLKNLGVKPKILKEIAPLPSERIVGHLHLHFKQLIVFTTRRMISSTLPLMGMQTEWRADRKLVIMGGSYQVQYSNLAGIARAPSRIHRPHGGHGAAATVIKAVGPSIAKQVYPYEIQILGLDGTIINRLYGITSAQAETIADLAAKAGLKFFIPRLEYHVDTSKA